MHIQPTLFGFLSLPHHSQKLNEKTFYFIVGVVVINSDARAESFPDNLAIYPVLSIGFDMFWRLHHFVVQLVVHKLF